MTTDSLALYIATIFRLTTCYFDFCFFHADKVPEQMIPFYNVPEGCWTTDLNGQTLNKIHSVVVMDLNSCILHLNLTLYTDSYTADLLYIHNLKTALYEATV